MAFKSLSLGPWPGGLNTRDQAGELSPEELSDGLNVTIDERGALEKRLGYERRYGSAVGSGRVSNLFAWTSRGFLIAQIGTGMHKDGGAAFHTWTTSARVGMCEFLGNLVMIHPVDGVRMYDGTTVTGPFANFPLGDTCATWQNKCWFAGNPASGDGDKVMYTDIGVMTMGVNNFNKLREKDTQKVTLLTGASGLDISGRPGLLAFKGDSAYRIYDSSNGAYNTIDAAIGCGSNIGAVSAYGRTYVVNERGIYYTNGIDPMVEASAKVENVFHRSIINQSRDDLYCAGRYQDRLYFSLPRVGATENSLVLELNPQSGWIMAHSNAASCYAMMGASDLAFGSPSTNGLVFNSHRTGADDGAAITSYVQSAWLNPAFGNLINIRRARFIGSGEFDATLLRDFEAGASLPSMHIDVTGDVPLYDDTTAEYDTDDYYGPANFQDHQDFWSVGKVREFAIRIDETGTTVRSSQPVLGGAEPVIGGWGLSRVLLWNIDLGLR